MVEGGLQKTMINKMKRKEPIKCGMPGKEPIKCEMRGQEPIKSETDAETNTRT